MWKIAIPLLLLCAVVAGSLVTDRPLPKADFTFINRGDVNTLDLQRMSWMQDLRVARMCFEGLVRNDVFTWGYDISPGVAERWEVTYEPNPLTGAEEEVYTFHLRKDAKWSNGEPVTSHDFVYSWRRAMIPDTVSDYAGLFFLIRDGQQFYDWRQAQIDEYAELPDSEKSSSAAMALFEEAERVFKEGLRGPEGNLQWKVGIEAPDDHTLRVALTQPTPYFLDLCAFAVFYPVYPPLVRQYELAQAHTGLVRIESGWTKPPLLVSNGPFKLTVWRYKRDMYFEQNEHFWDKGSMDIRTIKIPSVEDGNAQVLAFQTGSVDWVSDVSPSYKADMLIEKRQFYAEHQEEYDRLVAEGWDQIEIDRRLPPDPRKNIHAIPAFGTYWYNFNCEPNFKDGRPNPFHDARVRRAFAMCVDKQQICDDVQRIGNPPARTIIPPNSIGGYETPKGLECVSDAKTPEEREAIISRARALLAEAGWPDPATFPTVEIMFNKDGGHDLIAQAVQKHWTKNLGVNVVLRQKEIKVYRDDLKNANYMVTRAGWYGDYGDPTTFLDLSHSDDGNNDRKYKNPEYDALLADAKLERDPARRMEILHEAESMIMDRDLPILPLFHYVTLYLFDANEVTGINSHPRTTQNLYLIDILGDGVGAETPKHLPQLEKSGEDAQ